MNPLPLAGRATVVFVAILAATAHGQTASNLTDCQLVSQAFGPQLEKQFPRFSSNCCSDKTAVHYACNANNRLTMISFTDPFWNFEGPIPPQLGDLSELQTLNLFLLNGTIPKELSKLTKLKNLALGNCRLTGSIPPEVAGMPQLQSLDLNGNMLTGSIPTEIGSANLSSLSLHGSKLSGAIPVEIGSLANLAFLDLADNNLSGTIPSQLGRLKALQQLRLSGNDLTGSIPLELSSITTMYFLDVSGNCLSNVSSYPPNDHTFPASVEKTFKGEQRSNCSAVETKASSGALGSGQSHAHFGSINAILIFVTILSLF